MWGCQEKSVHSELLKHLSTSVRAGPLGRNAKKSFLRISRKNENPC